MTSYDQENSARYRAVKEQLWRSRVELYSMLALIGDVSGKKVIDVACGEGWLTRALRRRGAFPVVGVDLSPEMIALARQRESEESLGIEYGVEDARDERPEQDFDLVTSNWLLVYARSRTELARMCRGLARRVRPGGRCVTLITNPDLYTWQDSPPDYRKYGFEARLPPAGVEGAAVTFTFPLGDASLEIENYYLPASAYADGLRSAGFRDVAFHGVELEPDPRAGDEGDYWEDFLRQPVAVMIDAIRG